MLLAAWYLSPFRIAVIAICVVLLVVRMVLRFRGPRDKTYPRRPL